MCQGCQQKKGTEKHRTHHRPAWRDARNQVPEEPRKWEQKANTSKKDKVAERHHTPSAQRRRLGKKSPQMITLCIGKAHSFCTCQREASVTSLPAAAPSGSRACGWSVEKLDHEEEMGATHASLGSMLSKERSSHFFSALFAANFLSHHAPCGQRCSWLASERRHELDQDRKMPIF